MGVTVVNNLPNLRDALLPTARQKAIDMAYAHADEQRSAVSPSAPGAALVESGVYVKTANANGYTDAADAIRALAPQVFADFAPLAIETFAPQSLAAFAPQSLQALAPFRAGNVVIDLRVLPDVPMPGDTIAMVANASAQALQNEIVNGAASWYTTIRETDVTSALDVFTDDWKAAAGV